MPHFGLEGIRRHTLDRIRRAYQERYLPHVVPVPSGRFGIYAVARELFSPGDRVLISPLTCRTVVESLLAAGVTPVFVDIELETGNIDLRKLTGGMLSHTKGIIATNLYGNPDDAAELQRLARSRGLYFIEDCAHILDTALGGSPIGSFGDVSIFSFKKYFDQPGGIVTARAPDLAKRVERRVAGESRSPSLKHELLRLAQYSVERGAGPGFTRWISQFGRAIAAAPSGKFAVAECESPSTGPDAAHCTAPTTASLLRTLDCISRQDEIVRHRIEDTQDTIRSCALSAKMSKHSERPCLLVVPFWSAKRNEIIARMKERGIPTYFTYCPPLNRVFTAGVCSDYLTEDALTEWCAHILPVDVRHRREFSEEVARQCL